MKFILGIGNPGSTYDQTRHNIGFCVVDTLCGQHKSKWKTSKSLKSSVASFGPGNDFLVKPRTFVNNTGEAVLAALKEHPSLKAEDVLIVCDDVNLPFGKMRLRASGSSGGHKGLESVMRELESKDFPRLRIGVGRDAMPKDLSTFVLEKFSKEEMKQLTDITEKAALVSEKWAVEGFPAAMAELNK